MTVHELILILQDYDDNAQVEIYAIQAHNTITYPIDKVNSQQDYVFIEIKEHK